MSSISRLKIGCIADDFTGATDLANNLVRAGMRCVQTIGVPQAPLRMPPAPSPWPDARLEVSLSNTAWLVHDDSTGWKPLQTLAVPVIPSAKVILDGDSSGRQAWGLAAGLGLPWGSR